jgi:hypothetical protein
MERMGGRRCNEKGGTEKKERRGNRGRRRKGEEGRRGKRGEGEGKGRREGEGWKRTGGGEGLFFARGVLHQPRNEPRERGKGKRERGKGLWAKHLYQPLVGAPQRRDPQARTKAFMRPFTPSHTAFHSPHCRSYRALAGTLQVLPQWSRRAPLMGAPRAAGRYGWQRKSERRPDEHSRAEAAQPRQLGPRGESKEPELAMWG